MKQQILSTIKQYNMLNSGDEVFVALSGGADSTALLCVLNELSIELNITLRAVHINHCLRGAESDFDQKFCEKLCKRLSVPLKVFVIDVKSKIKGTSQSLEQGARNIRYECFEKEANGAKIATAHNLDDVAETMIFNITRGCSLSGLSSIPAVRDNIIRPLINTPRVDIENYLKEIHQDFVTDSTNLTDDYTRNKIRHNVVPQLKKINPSFLQSVNRLRESALSVDEYLKKQSFLLENDAQMIKNQEKAIILEYIKQECKKQIGVELSSVHINDCYNSLMNNTKCQLPKNNYFYVSHNNLCFGKIDLEDEISFNIALSSNVKTPYNTYKIQKMSYEEYKNIKKVHNLFLNNVLDYDKICDNPRLRSKQSGDMVKMPSRYNKPLRKLFTELKISSSSRYKLAVLSVGDKIAWVEGIGTCAGFVPTKNTKNVIIISMEVDYYK